jgi:hypothetical protein
VGPPLERWRSQPRAVRWAVLFGVALVAYLLAVEPMIDAGNERSVRAERAAAELEAVRRQSGAIQEAEAAIAVGVARFGGVMMPEAGSGRDRALSEKIRQILSDRGVRDSRISQQRGTELKGPSVEQMVGSDQYRVERVVFSVEVTDKASTVMGVLADVERLPEVAAIGEVTLRKVSRDEDRVQLVMSPEAWVLRERSEGGRR